MLESPLVPDDSTPGTQDPLRSGRPLTRRELREREAAESLRTGASTSIPDAAAPPPTAPSAPAVAPVSPPATRAAARPAFDDLFWAAAPAATPASPARPAAQSRVAPAAPAAPASPLTPVAPASAPALPTPADDAPRRARRAASSHEPTVVPVQVAPVSIPSAPPELNLGGAEALDIFGVLSGEPARDERTHAVTAHEPAAGLRSSRHDQRGDTGEHPAASARSSRRAPSTPPGRRRGPSDPGVTAAANGGVARTVSAPRARRRARGIASIVAMSFVAMLAVTTTIPALSLLSEDDVQALALSQENGDSIDGQSLAIGDVTAPSVDREGYASQTIEEYAEAAGIRAEATFTNNPNGTIQWPFAVGVHIGDRFGYRDCAGCSEDHHGQDFNPGFGAQIQAIADGVVSESTDEGGSLGVVTMIDHQIDGQTVTSVYAHMQYDSRRMEIGDVIKVGDVVGLTGTTGMSTGPHLHFEIRIGGIDGEWVDPLEWLYANTN
ncbi:M23 family metallopeptidase [Agromyces sp. Marseille-Q5079]|uniref:M23 family metallopeptidase n=1 Tax=Agromyces sp. Marseille-Q5079 TaxID=3439059 RepID=UPI003D9C7FFD